MSVQKVIGASSEASGRIMSNKRQTKILNTREIYDKGAPREVLQQGQLPDGKSVAITRIGSQLYLTDMQHNMLYGSKAHHRVEKH
jgi:hypothetical protein